jgi:radical SAM superfamily enzyme YgiQ (UPF0313 family)
MLNKLDSYHPIQTEKNNFLITLLRPSVISSLYAATSPVTPPLAIAYLTASLEAAGFEVYPIDAPGEDIDRVTFFSDKGYRLRGITVEEILDRIPLNSELIGVSCMFTQDWLFVKELINEIKKKFSNVPIIVGGEHITAVPEEVLRDCPVIDICVLGEGEETIVDVANYYYGVGKKIEDISGIVYHDNNGDICRTKPRKRIRDIESIPRPNWDRFPIENYLSGKGYGHGPYRGRTMPILATRGCPYQCTFCTKPQMWGNPFYTRRPADVVDEIEYYIKKYKAENIDFYDLTVIVRKDWIIEFGQLLKERSINIHYSLPSTRSEAIDKDVAAILAETGCTYLAYSAESGSESTLKKIKKNINLDKMYHSMRVAKKNGINVRCNFVIGFPHETRLDVFKTLLFQLKLAFAGIDEAPIFGFAPYPGSELFNYLRKMGKIPHLDEDYYKSLLIVSDLTKSSCYSDLIGARELAFYRLIGVILFFSLSYLLFPWRIFRSIRNIFFRQIMETTFEQRIFEFLQAYKLVKKKN